MTEDQIIAWVSALPGVTVVTAGEGNGAPAAAWGDTFFSYDPALSYDPSLSHDPPGDQPADRRMPFATIVTHDYQGFDTASRLDRDGVFRVNIAVGRRVFEELVGYRPGQHSDHVASHDYTALDRVIPHPIYAAQGWVSVLNPGPETSGLVRELLTQAHAREFRRHST